METQTKTEGEEKEKNRGSKRHAEAGREDGRARVKRLEADAERFRWSKHAKKKCALSWQGEERGKKHYTFEVCLSHSLSLERIDKELRGRLEESRAKGSCKAF